MIKTERNILEIIEKIKKKIPSNFDARKDLVKDFDKLIESIKYSAPEMIPYRWGQVGRLLEIYLDQADTEWKVDIQNIMAGTE
ncbi:MAG: hypothetical protein ACXAC2_00470 [Candidatus Kariarchaeaceae archaeon]|jgi:hypothetical protein